MGWVLGMPGGVEPGRLVLLRRSPGVPDAVGTWWDALGGRDAWGRRVCGLRRVP